MKPIHTEIYDSILCKINSGEWPVDHMLPREMDLCDQFSVSRTSVRTAVLNLVNDGYLRRVKGKGTFVTAPLRIEESTIFIESFAEEMRKRGQSIQSEVLELRVMTPEPSILERLHQRPGSTVLKLSRLRYVRDSFHAGPIVLTTSYFPERMSFLQNCNFDEISLHRALEENGIAKKNIEKRISAVVLGFRESLLMGVPEGSTAILITSVAHDDEGNFIEYCESLYPNDRNEFIIKLKV